MKLLAKTLLLGAALSLGAAAYAQKCGGEIKFAQGKTETTLKGSVTGDKFCEYTFYAKKGQRLKVKTGSKDHPHAVLWSPVNQQLESGQYFLLPKSGKYVLRVLLYRNDARKNVAFPFTLHFEISALKK